MEMSKSALLTLIREVSKETEEKVSDVYLSHSNLKPNAKKLIEYHLRQFGPNKMNGIMDGVYWYEKMDAMIERIIKEDKRFDFPQWENKDLKNG